MNKDVFDEFEFKPITQGLGFHRQATPQTPPQPVPKQFSATTAYYPETTQNPKAKIPPANHTVEAILKTLNEQKKYEITNEKQALKTQNLEEKFVRSHWNFSAVLLDAMLIFSMNLICLIIVLSVTKVDLFLNLLPTHPDSLKLH